MRASADRLLTDVGLSAVVAATVVAFAAGSSGLDEVARAGRPARWAFLLVLLAAAAAAAASRRRLLWPVAYVAVPAVALVSLSVVSAAWSVAPELTLERGATIVVLIAVVALLASTGAFEPLLDGVALGAVAVAVAGLVTLAASPDSAVQSATYEFPARYQGFGENPNTVPLLLAVALPLTARRLAGSHRLVTAAALALLLGSIVASGSRGALLAGSLALLILAALAPVSPRARLLLAASVVAVLAAGIAIVALPQPRELPPTGGASASAPAPQPRYLDADAVRPLGEDLGRASGGGTPLLRRRLLGASGRVEAWSGAIEQALERPLLGYGFGTESRVFVDRYYAFVASLPENSFIGWALQLGAAGLALFLAAIVGLAAAARHALRFAPPARRLALAAAAAAVAAGLAQAVVQSYVYSVGNIATLALWICAAVLPAAAAEAR